MAMNSLGLEGRWPSPEVVFPLGTELGNSWCVVGVVVDARRVRIRIRHATGGEEVTLALEDPASPSRPGPLDVGTQRISYQRTDLPFERFREAGLAVGERLRAAGDPSALVRAWVATRHLPLAQPQAHDEAPAPGADTGGPAGAFASLPWRERLRTRLVGHPDTVLTLREVFAPDELPPWPCALPWTRLELNNRTAGPCCSDYQTTPAPWHPSEGLHALWNGPALRAFRRALTGSAPYGTCRRSCPTLRGRSEDPASVRVFGGDEAFVAREIELLEDLFAGREVMRGGPLKVSFTTTTYCNYDCLMCAYGEFGTLADELPASFYDGLATLAPGLRLLEALGGEPLASPVFRDFLANFDFHRFPSLRVALITNGSYLTPKELNRYRHVPIDNLTVSLNAASPETYLRVNRGLPFARIREHLDALHALRRSGALRCSVTYSMVILKANVHEVRAFAELARRDGVRYRYLLPNHDRNGQSIMNAPDAMRAARDALDALLQEERAAGNTRQVALLVGETEVLSDRIARGIYQLIPEGAVPGRG